MHFPMPAIVNGPQDATRGVVAAVIERDGRLLVARRAADKRHGGLWEFPGGKLEAGESLAKAASRELYEELGVIATEVGDALYRVRDAGSPYVIVFVPVSIVGEPQPCEHQAVAWARPAELVDYALAPSDAAFVRDTKYFNPKGAP